jgi:hypothetical protein
MRGGGAEATQTKLAVYRPHLIFKAVNIDEVVCGCFHGDRENSL